MLYTEMTKRALKLCFHAHKDQTDKSGLPYVFHPFHIAEQMDTEDEIIVALLHDVIEDTEYTVEDIQNFGFTPAVVAAISLMTHADNTPYMEYIRALKVNPIAKKVKLCDLRHNSDLTRLENVDDKAVARVEKYKEAIRILSE